MQIYVTDFGLKNKTLMPDSNPRYLRASVIYDALLGEPEPAVKYPTLTAQREYQPPPR